MALIKHTAPCCVALFAALLATASPSAEEAAATTKTFTWTQLVDGEATEARGFPGLGQKISLPCEAVEAKGTKTHQTCRIETSHIIELGGIEVAVHGYRRAHEHDGIAASKELVVLTSRPHRGKQLNVGLIQSVEDHDYDYDKITYFHVTRRDLDNDGGSELCVEELHTKSPGWPGHRDSVKRKQRFHAFKLDTATMTLVRFDKRLSGCPWRSRDYRPLEEEPIRVPYW